MESHLEAIVVLSVVCLLCHGFGAATPAQNTSQEIEPVPEQVPQNGTLGSLTEKLDEFTPTLTDAEYDLLDDMLSREECTEEMIDEAIAQRDSPMQAYGRCTAICRRGTCWGTRRCKCSFFRRPVCR